MTIKNKLGEYKSVPIDVNTEDYENIIELSKQFYLSGYEMETENGFVGNYYYTESTETNYLQLGFHKDSDFSKIKEGEILEAERVSEIITVNEGFKTSTWSFFKVL